MATAPLDFRKRAPSDHAGLRLGRRMLRIRQLRGESQENFARRFEVSVGTYWRWEKYGPPRHLPTRQYIRQKLHSLDTRALYAKTKKYPAADLE